MFTIDNLCEREITTSDNLRLKFFSNEVFFGAAISMNVKIRECVSHEIR